jgi:hypothetical protein
LEPFFFSIFNTTLQTTYKKKKKTQETKILKAPIFSTKNQSPDPKTKKQETPILEPTILNLEI